MGDAKKLHTEWQEFKNGMGAVMIKDAGLKFDGGLGPKLDSLDAKVGTEAGQKIANDIKGIIVKYRKILNEAKPKKSDFREVSSKTPYQTQKTKGTDILKKIETFVVAHKPLKK